MDDLGGFFILEYMKYYCKWSLVVGLLLSGVQDGWGLICATGPAAGRVQQDGARQGQVQALVIYARFRNEGDGRSEALAFTRRFFDPEEPGSLTHFYQEMSRGQFSLTGTVLPRWYTSDQPASAYVATERGEGGRFGTFSREILQAVDAEVDLGLYDNDGPDGAPNSGDDDGEVDFIFLNTLTAPEGFIIGKATGVARLGLDLAYTSNDRAINGGVIQVRSDDDSGGTGGVLQRGHTFELAVGHMAHEYGHVLGLPDLFDASFAQSHYGELEPAEDSAGIGYWGLMGWGTLGWNEVDGPNPFCSWSLEQLGWIGVENDLLVVVEENLEDVVFEDVNAGGKVYKLPVQGQNRYFLVEHRRSGTSYYERNLPASGLLIWQIDKTPGAFNSSETRKLVDLVCADGLFRDAGYPEGRVADPDFGRDNLDFWAHDENYRTTHSGNQGDATDVFDGVVATDFWAASNPAAPSGIRVGDIRRRGDDMVADLYLEDLHRAGLIQPDEVWEDSIWIVGDVVVRADTRLIIKPGTRVMVGEDLRRLGRDPERCEVVIQGDLITASSSRDSVLFTSAAAEPRPGAWYGIVAGATGRLTIRNTIVEYARNGLSGSNMLNPQILNGVTIRQASRHGIHFDRLQGQVTLTRLEASAAGSTGVKVIGQGTLEVQEGRFAGNGHSGLERVGGRLECALSEFVDNGLEQDEGANLKLGVGVSGRVSQNRFEGGVGIRCRDSRDVLIEENRLVDHRIGLISASSRPWIQGNEFIGNELALQISGFVVPTFLALNIIEGTDRLLDNQASIEVVARNNWWGQVDENWIEERISGEVIWRPFLNFDPRVPVGFTLSQNFPNPFNGTTVIDYTVGIEVPIVAGEVDMVLEVRSIIGGLVRRLVRQPAAPGFYSVVWDGRNDAGEPVASGVYYYQLKVGPITLYKRLLLLK